MRYDGHLYVELKINMANAINTCIDNNITDRASDLFWDKKFCTKTFVVDLLKLDETKIIIKEYGDYCCFNGIRYDELVNAFEKNVPGFKESQFIECNRTDDTIELEWDPNNSSPFTAIRARDAISR